MRATQTKTALSSLLFSLSISAVQGFVLASPLPGVWQYKGCYNEINGRALDGAGYADGALMTNEACIAYCQNRGFQYAGTEYSQECYCGSSLPALATAAAATDCSMACSGNATQACGAGGKLSVYYSSAPVGPQPNPGVNGFNSIGCYAEGTTGRALTYGVGSIPNAEMTVAKCTAACHTAGYILAGVEYAGECYCGNTIANGGLPASSGCNMLCNGNSSEICGGGNRLNVYDYMNQYVVSTSSSAVASSTSSVASSSSSVVVLAVSTSSTSAAPVPTGPVQPATVGNYVWYGCKTEATGIRALNGATYAADTMTLESCQAFCSAFTYFGVEYARECYCGNSFNTGSVAAPATDCSFTCMGNAFEYCGAGNRLSVYAKNGTAPLPSTTTSSAPSATSSTAALTGVPSGWSYQGCYIDGAQGRILPVQLPDSQTNTQESCANACAAAGYLISGTEYSVQCFCGNATYNGAVKTLDSDCTSNCAGNANEKCGGGDRVSIVSKGAPVAFAPPTAQKSGLNGSWTYQGCVEDNVNQKRTFFWQLFFPGTMTANLCLSRCAKYGYMAAGLEYGEECYCGDPANIATVGATFRPESECNVVCAGNSSAYCGGGGRLSTYFWTGTPMYSWDFPQDYRAGQYQFLINGPTIPLMTMETIKGKVSFISKWGTGPGGETGAYELDLSLVPNGAAAAWRTLHLKTDVFCAAGAILPDKGGRQLTLGGWSGDSTYGTRLYWPDGSTGVPGTHDWQENVNELKLQAGRWYPTAMVMSNGSILVVGGETGSNAAAVPSIEILPATGSPPLFMDWLARTDPNNLYPFLSILPSGRIFVAYYNEARILNEVTFETVKVLPNAPGAVNDDKGGRTYPLQGTAVPLPMHWPWTDPMGILICGGSTNGVASALDNCVSTFPEAANPTWTIERLPSFRVMPCIAPLPDGTYLIANGAQHGVAGFGLANNPNLNAMLYNPSKPYGSRITVMANTTIARLYHSEAITLLDGRVLISGSNPEDGVNPEEYRVEVFIPPYLLNGLPRPTFAITNKDWSQGQTGIPFTLGVSARNGAITATLLAAVSSTHGNSMGARTLMPKVSCAGTSCTVDAPPAYIAPPGWYQFFVLDGGVPAVGVYVRIGGDPANLGNWPNFSDFTVPGV
ncbi:glyoxal oxidase-like protein [Cercophora scortea]|uniref:Glyoxal oxidase-like protein n=1 Tax=Cercophora scortea TaxID=314031 RepID=A0AAE0MLG5_9PEZI|nr:glyoxal oxidase-like protein [Cercophora scortea]